MPRLFRVDCFPSPFSLSNDHWQDDDDDDEPDAKPAKKTKVKAEAADGAEVDWATRCANGTAAQHTIPELKEALKAVGLKLAGKKDELVARLMEHYAS